MAVGQLPYLFEVLQKLEQDQTDPANSQFFLKAQWIRYFVSRYDRMQTVYHSFYTLHDIRHLDHVMANLAEILKLSELTLQTRDGALSYHELFYLICSAYLHDVGMFVQYVDDESNAEQANMSLASYIRYHHHERSADFVFDHAGQFCLDDADAHIIARLCQGHRLESLADNPDFDDSFDSSGHVIRVRMLSELLRVADELDMSHERAPAHERRVLEQIPGFSEISREHWMRHYYVESVSFVLQTQTSSTFQDIKVRVNLQVPDDLHYEELSRHFKERLDRYLHSSSFERANFTIKLEAIKQRISTTLETSIIRHREVRILYVDDNENDLEQVATLLEHRGFDNCTTAKSATKALSIVMDKENPMFHVFILDLKMPTLENPSVENPSMGVELGKLLRAQNPTGQIIIFTVADESENPALTEARANGYRLISKDTVYDKLVDEVETTIRKQYLLV